MSWAEYCEERDRKRIAECEAEITRLRADLERAVQLCLQHSIATGHADTADQLMDEVILQVQELRKQRDSARAEVAALKEKNGTR